MNTLQHMNKKNQVALQKVVFLFYIYINTLKSKNEIALEIVLLSKSLTFLIPILVRMYKTSIHKQITVQLYSTNWYNW